MFKILNFKRLDSTNLKAKEILEENTLIIASEQTKGKGRFNRKWSSSKGGVYLSLILAIKNIKELPFFTFAAAISTQKAVEEEYKVKTIIKWPNDLLFKGKKLCGILTENVFSKEKFAIVGVGINTNNKIPLSLRKKAVSLGEITKTKIDNQKIIKTFLKNFEKYYNFLKKKKYSKIILDWKKNSFLGSKIKVKTLKKIYQGIAFDVDKDCFLILRTREGKKIKIREGDVFLE